MSMSVFSEELSHRHFNITFRRLYGGICEELPRLSGRPYVGSVWNQSLLSYCPIFARPHAVPRNLRRENYHVPLKTERSIKISTTTRVATL